MVDPQPSAHELEYLMTFIVVGGGAFIYGVYGRDLAPIGILGVVIGTIYGLISYVWGPLV